jgi:hypothetical protein
MKADKYPVNGLRNKFIIRKISFYALRCDLYPALARSLLKA